MLFWVNRAPSEVAAPSRDGIPPKTGSKHPTH